MDKYEKLISEINDALAERFFTDEPLSMIDLHRRRDLLRRLAKIDIYQPSPPPSAQA
ncbi:hypothetical protein [Acidocella aromatica]|uniref:Uncharacterized protein n=1 Tax=Acidocella aromatica TaxID=1303579 RepID=A0A840VA74_9PROT|nr:hypothetical protein [Acidocella aromatica]MBB5372464.1 hypothetical protein [Acidocella aromatica]